MYNFDWVQLSATCRKQTNASNHIVTSFIVGFMKGFKQVRRARSAVKILPKPRPDGTTVRNEVLDISTYSHDHYWKTSDRTIPNVQQNCRSTSNRNHPYIKVSEISRCLNLHHWYSLTIWWFQPESSPSRGEHNKYLKPPPRWWGGFWCMGNSFFWVVNGQELVRLLFFSNQVWEQEPKRVGWIAVGSPNYWLQRIYEDTAKRPCWKGQFMNMSRNNQEFWT